VVVGFAFVLCAVAALVAGLFPALHAGRQRDDLLGGTGIRATGSRTLARVQRVLTVTQVALGLTLLTTAGLLVNSLWRLSAVDPGFRPDGVVGFSLTVPSDHPRADTAALYARLLDATRTIPGLVSAGWITNLPPEARKGVFVPFTIEGRPATGGVGGRPVCNLQVTSEDYFATIGIPLARGRGFTASDVAGALPVAIVNETLARRYFPGEDPLGRKIVTPFDRTPRQIVGIIRTVHDRGLAVPPWRPRTCLSNNSRCDTAASPFGRRCARRS
jgi:putative ABC transport system permease protein